MESAKYIHSPEILTSHLNNVVANCVPQNRYALKDFLLRAFGNSVIENPVNGISGAVTNKEWNERNNEVYDFIKKFLASHPRVNVKKNGKYPSSYTVKE